MVMPKTFSLNYLKCESSEPLVRKTCVLKNVRSFWFKGSYASLELRGRKMYDLRNITKLWFKENHSLFSNLLGFP